MQYYRRTLKRIYTLMFKESNHVSYKHSYPFLNDGRVNPVYRAIIKVSDEYYDKLEQLIAEANQYYFMENPGKKRLPMNLPRLLNNNDVFKIQIHENRAYSSLNYKDLESVPIIRYSSHINYVISKEENETRKAKISAAFQESGYEVGFQYDDYHQIMETLTIEAQVLCELFKCDSIQHRIQTGVQIRGNFFVQDIERRIVASPLQSIGVLLLPASQDVEVLHSHRRRVRSDAKFIDGHPDEIILEIDDSGIPYGRLYRCFNN